jgi:hypothetical protein
VEQPGGARKTHRDATLLLVANPFSSGINVACCGSIVFPVNRIARRNVDARER